MPVSMEQSRSSQTGPAWCHIGSKMINAYVAETVSPIMMAGAISEKLCASSADEGSNEQKI